MANRNLNQKYNLSPVDEDEDSPGRAADNRLQPDTPPDDDYNRTANQSKPAGNERSINGARSNYAPVNNNNLNQRQISFINDQNNSNYQSSTLKPIRANNSGSSTKSIDSRTKNVMLRNNREQDPGIYSRRNPNTIFFPYSYDFVRTTHYQSLSRRFVEDHAVELTHIPFYWNLNQSSGPYFGLKLKMCQIQTIQYDFEFGTPTGQTRIPNLPSLIEKPDRCLKLDFSLNDLQELSYDAVRPFPNVRHLDASLNRIENYPGIELCGEVVFVNLSHNFITQINHLHHLRYLTELNLSMNDIRDISAMPALSNLTVLHLNNNRLVSLDGIQSLSRLSELHVQKNKLTDIQPLATTFTLKVLNASDNMIHSLHDTLVVLQALTNLHYLYLHDNPIQLERGYANAVQQLTTAHVLDNVPVRPDALNYDQGQGILPILNNKQYDSLGGIRQATTHVFTQQMENQKRKTMNYINQLQLRIRELQEDYVNYESRVQRNLNDVLKFYDALQYDVTDLKDPKERDVLTPGEKPWAGMSLPNRRNLTHRSGYDENDHQSLRNRRMDDRKKLRDPSEILHLAAADLQMESGQTNRYGANRSNNTYSSNLARTGGGQKTSSKNEYRGPPNATREQFMAF